MTQDNAPDLAADGWLKALGIDSLLQWDVLAFVYRHRTSLVGAEAIAVLLGYPNDPVVAALDVLAALGFVERSRATHGVRLYRFALPADSPRRDSFERLTALADSRAGRLHLVKALRPPEQATPQGRQAAPGVFAEPGPSLPAARLCPAAAALPHAPDGREEEGGPLWRKAI